MQSLLYLGIKSMIWSETVYSVWDDTYVFEYFIIFLCHAGFPDTERSESQLMYTGIMALKQMELWWLIATEDLSLTIIFSNKISLEGRFLWKDLFLLPIFPIDLTKLKVWFPSSLPLIYRSVFPQFGKIFLVLDSCEMSLSITVPLVKMYVFCSIRVTFGWYQDVIEFIR